MKLTLLAALAASMASVAEGAIEYRVTSQFEEPNVSGNFSVLSFNDGAAMLDELLTYQIIADVFGESIDFTFTDDNSEVIAFYWNPSLDIISFLLQETGGPIGDCFLLWFENVPSNGTEDHRVNNLELAPGAGLFYQWPIVDEEIGNVYEAAAVESYITVISTAATPEPSALLVWLVLGSAALVLRVKERYTC